ncbi:MAG: hypothetical protein Kow00121_05530 [Elainellaceae cyanobacterium]
MNSPLHLHPLSAEQLLRLWEIGQGQHPLDRALTLLAFACPDQSPVDLASLPIGQRDRYLLSLRELTFGTQMDSYAECPYCQERLEFSLTVADMQVNAPESLLLTDHQFTLEDWHLRFRLPTSLDLAAVFLNRNPETATVHLLHRCLVQATRQGEPIASENLPPQIWSCLQQQIAYADPQAEMVLNLTCPACQQEWQVLFDIGEFLWAEVRVQAKRLLQDIDLLARVYGWRESDILAMSATRRQHYLENII